MGNLLNRALPLTGSVPITWYAFTSRTEQTTGQYVSNFAAAEVVPASVQPVPRTLIQAAGLELNKEYVMVYCSTKMIDLKRGRSPDRFVFSNYVYEIVTNTEWYPVNGWNGSFAVKIKPASEAP